MRNFLSIRRIRIKERINRKKPLVLFGCGNMGKAMLKGWIKNGLEIDAVKIISPHATSYIPYFSEFGIPENAFLNSIDLLEDCQPEVVIFAVKPQKIDEVIPHCTKFTSCGSLFISLIAGKSLDYFNNGLCTNNIKNIPIIRTMPNTPAAIGYGMTVAIGNKFVTQNHIELCTSLMESVGACEWIEEEDQMDIVTAVSGSGPAYIFLLAESIAAAGIRMGLKPELATKLAIQTLLGAANLLHQQHEATPLELTVAEKLRRQVTSPNGTTFEALKILMSDEGMNDLMMRAIFAATNRSRELGGKSLLPPPKGPFNDSKFE